MENNCCMVSKVPGYERRFFIPILSQKENAMNIKLYAGNADYPDYLQTGFTSG